MTDMRRISVVITNELDQRLLELKRNGSGRESYSEIVRKVLDKGFEAIQNADNSAPRRA